MGKPRTFLSAVAEREGGEFRSKLRGIEPNLLVRRSGTRRRIKTMKRLLKRVNLFQDEMSFQYLYLR